MSPFFVIFGAALVVASCWLLAAVAVVHGQLLITRIVRLAVRAFGWLFLAAIALRTNPEDRGLFAGRQGSATPLCAIALAAALGAAAIVGAVSAGYAAPLAREPGDIVYQPSLAIRADGRLALAEGVTIAEAAADYAGPGDYWSAACRATLDGYEPVVFEALDASRGVYWRASISRAGAIETSGPGRAALAPLAPFLAELAQRVRCK